MPAFRPSRNTLIAAALAALYAVTAFVVHLRWYPIGDLGVESDFYAELVVSAQRLAAGEFAVANYPFKGPLYSFVLVAVHAVAGLFGADWYRAAVLLNALAAAGVLVVSYRLLHRLFGIAVAVPTTLALALTYEVFLHAHKASSDMLFLLLQTAATAAMIGARTRRGIAAAGVVAGLAFLTRYSGAVLVPAGLVLTAWLTEDPLGAMPRLKRDGIFLLGFLVVTSPWFALNLAETGRLLSTGNVTNVVQDFYGGAKRAEIPPGGFHSLGQVVAHDPISFVSHLAGNVPRHLAKDMTEVVGKRVWPLTVLGALGLVITAWLGRGRDWGRRRRLDREQAAYLGIALVTFLSLCLVFHRARFSLPLAAPYFVLGYGMLLGLRGRPGRGEMVAAVGIALVVSGFQVGSILRGERFYRYRLPREILQQAPAVRATAQRTGAKTLMARKPHLAYYAGLDYRAYPGDPGPLDDFLQGARTRGVDLIAVGPWELEAFAGAVYLSWLDLTAGVARVGEAGTTQLFQLDRGMTPAEAVTVPAARALVEEILATRAAENWSGFAAAHAELARVLIPLGLWDEAARNLEGALALVAQHPDQVDVTMRDELVFSLAFCRLNQGDFAAGLALLGEDLAALSPAPNEEWQAIRHTVLARLLAGAGRKDDARRHFSAALELHRRAGRQEAAREMAAALAALRE